MGLHHIVRRLWREISGYNSMRRKRIAKRKLARVFDDAEQKLEALKEQATGDERIRCINLMFRLRMQLASRCV